MVQETECKGGGAAGEEKIEKRQEEKRKYGEGEREREKWEKIKGKWAKIPTLRPIRHRSSAKNYS